MQSHTSSQPPLQTYNAVVAAMDVSVTYYYCYTHVILDSIFSP